MQISKTKSFIVGLLALVVSVALVPAVALAAEASGDSGRTPNAGLAVGAMSEPSGTVELTKILDTIRSTCGVDPRKDPNFESAMVFIKYQLQHGHSAETMFTFDVVKERLEEITRDPQLNPYVSEENYDWVVMNVAKLYNYYYKINQTIIASDVTKTYGCAKFPLNVKVWGDGTLSYSSSNSSVATVDSSGTVRVNGAGNATITISASATGSCYSASKKVSIAVQKASQVITAPSSITKTYGCDRFRLDVVSSGDGSLSAVSSDESVVGCDANDTYVWVNGAGEAEVTITAEATKNCYSASKVITIKINKASTSRVNVDTIAAKTYTGAFFKPKPSVYFNGEILKQGTDYTLSYKNNRNYGTANVVITGKGNFTGTKTVKFNICKASVSKATVAKVAAKKYTGKLIKPMPKVTYKGKTLKRGSDYTLSYKNNKKRGTAKIIITGKGNFKGTKTVQFKIK